MGSTVLRSSTWKKTLGFFVVMIVWAATGTAQDLQQIEKLVREGKAGECVKQLTAMAEKGDPTAQNLLGELYDEAKGVSQNHGVAAAWFRKAADQGNASAQYNLGFLLENGFAPTDGQPWNSEEAAALFRKAAQAGHRFAQYRLGSMFLYGDGVEKNAAEGFSWLEKAARQGVVDAQNSLGMLYKNGEGTAKDPEKAYFWVALANRNGYSFNTDTLKTIEKSLSKGQLARTQEEISRFRPEPSPGK